MLATAALALGTTGVAHADNPAHAEVCGPVTVVAPNINAQICAEDQITDHDAWYALLRLWNNSSSETVTAYAQLSAPNGSSYSLTVAVAPNSGRFLNSGSVINPPGGASQVFARGHMSTPDGWNRDIWNR
jgi:hypothetical protein